MKAYKDWNLERNPSTGTPACACPWCGAVNDRAWNDEAHKPKRGDLALCVSCGEWTEFGPKLALIKPDEDAYNHLISSPDAVAYRKAWLLMKAKEEAEKP